jgi:hypothetical protein
MHVPGKGFNDNDDGPWEFEIPRCSNNPNMFFLGAKFATNPLKNGNSLTTFIQSKIRFHGHWPHILGGPSVVCLFGMLEKYYS